MPEVRLSDVVIPEVYEDYDSVDGPEKTVFVESGIAVSSPLLDQKANSGGSTVDIPFWKDLDATQEPNISTDDPADKATPNKITAGKMKGQNSYINQGYSTTDLAGELAGSDPMARIRSRFNTYWSRQWQRRMLSVTEGMRADNIANDSGDMVYDISIEDGTAATTVNKFSRSAFTAAAFTLGDMVDGVQAMAIHSVIYQRMIDNDDIEFVKDSNGILSIPTYMGKMVLVDDGMTVIAGGTSGFKFVTVLFGAGAIGYGNGSPKVPVEVSRVAESGNGSGVETLWERKTWLIHPFGYQFTDASTAGLSATLAELKLAANWTRVIERKNVPLAFLITNG